MKRISSISCLTVGKYWAEDIAEVFEISSVDIGLHFSLTTLPPLIISKTYSSPHDVLFDLLTSRLSKESIELEFELQWNTFVLKCGRVPDFVDGHHHIHQLPIIRDVITDFLKNKKVMTYMRVCSFKLEKPYLSKINIKKYVISFFSYHLKKQCTFKNIFTNKSFDGVVYVSAKYNYKSSFEKLLNSVDDGLLIMTHPGYCDKVLLGLDSYSLERESELSYLKSNEFMSTLLQKNIKILPLREAIKT